MGLLDGRRALVFGVANDHSIAWGIARALNDQGATVGFSSVESLIERRVRPLAESIGSTFVEPCDVQSDAEIRSVFARWGEAHGELDILVHALAFAKREDLDGSFVDTSRDGFALALDVSAYSLVAMAREARPLLRRGSSIMTLTYYGAEKVVTHYNVMGVAKAALEASVRYLAAASSTARSTSWPRCARTSRSRTSGEPPSTSPRTCRARSPARRSTSTAASTSWACPRSSSLAPGAPATALDASRQRSGASIRQRPAGVSWHATARPTTDGIGPGTSKRHPLRASHPHLLRPRHRPRPRLRRRPRRARCRARLQAHRPAQPSGRPRPAEGPGGPGDRPAMTAPVIAVRRLAG
jgi:enoyl-[acyl-carrier-protein] reductase (NADH)